jgi:hypothetical protein
LCLYARVPVAYVVTAPLPSCRMSEQLTNTNLAAHLKTPGRWGGDPACRGNGVAAARPCSPSVRSPSVRPAASAALEANIKTLQAEIARLEAVVAGQRADLERERHRANVLGDELLKATLALPPSCRSTAVLEGDRGGERRSRAWCAAPNPTHI